MTSKYLLYWHTALFCIIFKRVFRSKEKPVMLSVPASLFTRSIFILPVLLSLHFPVKFRWMKKLNRNAQKKYNFRFKRHDLMKKRYGMLFLSNTKTLLLRSTLNGLWIYYIGMNNKQSKFEWRKKNPLVVWCVYHTSEPFTFKQSLKQPLP